LATDLHHYQQTGGNMKPAEVCAPKKMFLDIPNAAEIAGFSVRHFRRIIDEERIRIVQIGRKFFIMGEDFERWLASNGPKAS
jgi:excisionase family DNA binding protein